MGLLDLVNLVLTWSFPGTLFTTWESLGPGEIGPHLGLTQSSGLVPHLDLIAVDSFLASPETGDSDRI